VLLGGGDEVALCETIAAQCRRKPLSLAGRTSLPEFVALIDQANLVVCHDSAAAHLAAALSRPLVCITGPTNPYRTGPYRRLDDAVGLDLDCAPCYLRRLEQCPYDHRCLRELSVDHVQSAIRVSLDGPENGVSHERSKNASQPQDNH